MRETNATWNSDFTLPTGFLEIYHDLETYGLEPQDKDRQAWLVRLVSLEEAKSLADLPSEVPPPVTDQCQLGLFMHGFNLPYFTELPNYYNYALWEETILDLQQAWHIQHFGEPTDCPMPFTQLGGYS